MSQNPSETPGQPSPEGGYTPPASTSSGSASGPYSAPSATPPASASSASDPGGWPQQPGYSDPSAGYDQQSTQPPPYDAGGYGQSGYGQQSYDASQQQSYDPSQPSQYAQPQQYGQPGQQQVSVGDENLWATLAHVSIPFIGFIGPLIVFMIYKDRSPWLKESSVEALNFSILYTIVLIVSGILSVVGIGLILYLVAAIGALVLCILAAMASNKHEQYKYPLNWRLVK